MSKMIVLLMDNEYPFTQEQISPYGIQNILVRQTLSTPRFNKNTTLAKANFLKNLKNKYLVKVEQLLQEEQTIHIMYQYVENKLFNVLKGASTLLINKINAQLRQFGRYLSNIGVRTLFSMDRMGFTIKQNLKYFMGVDFEWEEDPDEEYLQQFYQKQVEEILGPYLRKKYSPEITLSNTQNSIQKFQTSKLRKVSYSTLPSRYNRYCKIDQKLKQIKSHKIYDSEHQTRKPSSVQTLPKNSLKKLPYENKNLHAKRQQRKYSGDIKIEVMSKNKLYEKQSDIKSQYWRNKKNTFPKYDYNYNNQEQVMRSEAGSSKTKSRMEEMKEKQYREIYNMKKQYLRDFISVLQQEDQHQNFINQEQQKNVQKENKKEQLQTHFRKTQSQMFHEQDAENTTEQLQLMAKNAIQNSLKAIYKFKHIIYDV